MINEKLKIPFPVIVEGRYDKLRLECVMTGQILTTDGFGVFNKQEKTQLFRALAEKTPLILLTDSDGAGKLIRSHLTSILSPDKLIQLYIPRVKGKESRKKKPSAEGVLGVEGMEQKLLYELLSPYADEKSANRAKENPLSKTDLFIDGFTGCNGSVEKRNAFAEKVGLPAGMTPNAFLSALKVLMTYDEYLQLVGRDARKN